MPLVAHWPKTASVCGSSMTPAMSTPPRAPSSASVARIGAEVITGEAIRTRRRAPADRGRDRLRELAPWPGVNQARARVPPPEVDRGRLDAARALDVAALPELLEVGGVGGGERPRTRPSTSTFSWRVHESMVQLAEPVQTASPVADDVLVVHQVGDARDRRGPRSAARRGAPAGCSAAGGSPAGAPSRRCRAAGPRPRARRRRAARRRRGRPAGPAGGCRRARARACASRGRRKRGDALGDLLGALPAVGELVDLHRAPFCPSRYASARSSHRTDPEQEGEPWP